MVRNHACIAIGINHYQYFGPLNYAREDAQALRTFLARELQMATDRCVLLTDSSPPVADMPTYPNRQNILATLNWLCRQKLQSDDLLWCFFSGYGINWQGQDYLLPADADPAAIAKTGIALRDLFATLKSAPVQTVVLLLDINRAGTVNPELIGVETVQLAKQMHIPTILACQPGQFSHETAGLRHGVFTACLLEALRYNRCVNLDSLRRYLITRLPQLCDHHGLPPQDPVIAIEPPEKGQQLLWPQNGRIALPSNGKGYNSPEYRNGRVKPSPETNHTGTGSYGSPPPITNGKVKDSNSVAPSFYAQPEAGAAENSTDGPQPQSPALNPPSDSMPSAPESITTTRRKSSLLWLLLAAGAGALLFVLGVALGRTVFGISQTPTAIPAPLAQSEKNFSPEVNSGKSEVNSGKSEVNSAKSEVNSAKPASSQPQVLGAGEYNLDRTLLSLPALQASKLSYAIAVASQIRVSDPLYSEAQQQIDRWGAVILDIARARGKQGNFSGAIAAAKLVPKNRPQLRRQADKFIGQWQGQLKQQQANQELLRSAVASIRSWQLESYTRAIGRVRQIKAGQPQYRQAQQLIGQWGEAIYQIAIYRATRGQYGAAIEAASAVPSEAAVFPSAQNSIAQWRSRLKAR